LIAVHSVITLLSARRLLDFFFTELKAHSPTFPKGFDSCLCQKAPLFIQLGGLESTV